MTSLDLPPGPPGCPPTPPLPLKWSARLTRWSALLVCALSAIGSAVATPTLAGTATIVACIDHTQSAAGAPPFDGAGTNLGRAGWEPVAANLPSTDWNGHSDDCSFAWPNGGLRANSFVFEDEGSPSGGTVGWKFVAPADTRVAGIDFVRTVDLMAGGNGLAPQYLLADSDLKTLIESSTENISGSVTRSGLDLPGVQLQVACVSVPGSTTRPTDCRRYYGNIVLNSSRITLRDDAAPDIGSASGTLVTEPALRGQASVRVAAIDSGLGLYRAQLRLDGQSFGAWRSFVTGDPECTDLNPAAGTAYEFRDPTPCPRSGVQDFTFDLSDAPEGARRLQFLIEDAAGNATVAIDRQVTIDNVPPPIMHSVPSIVGQPVVGETLLADRGEWSGDDVTRSIDWLRCSADSKCIVLKAAGGAPRYALTAQDLGYTLQLRVTATNDQGSTVAMSEPTATVRSPARCSGVSCEQTAQGGPAGAPNGPRAARSVRLAAGLVNVRRLPEVLRFGQRPLIRGSLRTVVDEPVADAVVQVLERVAGRSGAFQPVATLRTDPTGDFSYLPRVGPSRTIRFSYRAFDGDELPSAIEDVSIRVGFGLRLKTSRHSLRGGQRLRFSGQVLGPGVPAGVRVELQALDGPSWRTFAVLPTRNGLFRYRYRFRPTPVTRRFAFRVRLVKGPGMAYETATSAYQIVRVRP